MPGSSPFRLIRLTQLPHAQPSVARRGQPHLDAVRARLRAPGGGVVAEDILALEVFGDGAEDGAEVVLGAWVERGARVADDEELAAGLLRQLAEAFRRTPRD